ncbi:group III truncated hemoglobin [Caulobacter sp. SL161]|uniref:group III truncated hemoglobin n=1 Tax=Caulobacter sp. SL161 TaxID=2995156 RepID=UPI0022740DF8|nr:group III truncated hemoglobin [Caulobacter sp. SL161]MCY1648951.1 group III truncated hemoglobin [Caulobacter sp. SL161]
MSVSPRSQARADAAPFTDEEIDRLVETFYARIRQHHRLGPVFETAIGPDGWPEHLATLKDFWSSVLNTSGRYKGQPVVAHRGVEGITEGLFTPWLGLFHMTCAELFDAPRAAIIGQKAERIAATLKLGLFHRSGAVA